MFITGFDGESTGCFQKQVTQSPCDVTGSCSTLLMDRRFKSHRNHVTHDFTSCPLAFQSFAGEV